MQHTSSQKGNGGMSVYIALLRGINVGANKRKGMANLKRTFESLGLMEVKTYIQSGNVLFVSEEKEEPLLDLIQAAIQRDFGFSVDLVLRTREEIKELLEKCPFSPEEAQKAEEALGFPVLHAALLPSPPTQRDIQRLNASLVEGERFEVFGREIYLLLPNGVHRSKLAAQLQKLDVPATARNMNTLEKLNELAGVMKE
jgi:uncharacterized protein (DUF1697 family)